MSIRQFASKSINFYRRKDNRNPNFQSPIMYPILNQSQSLMKSTISCTTGVEDEKIETLNPSTPYIRFESFGYLRQIILQRPKSLNALNHEMVLSITKALLKWQNEEDCHSIIIKSSSSNFSAGGDVLSLFEDKKIDAKAYFHDEYRLCHLISSFKKPIISFFNGITMGGGLGLGIHGRIRISTQSSRIAMPEAKIGFITDVGSSYFLPRLKGEIGTYLALTGNSLKGRQAFDAGITTHHFYEAHLIDELISSLQSCIPKDIESFIDQFTSVPPSCEDDYKQSFLDIPSPFPSIIDTIFKASTVEEIILNLKRHCQPDDQFLTQTLNSINSNSPTSLKTILSLLRRGKDWNLKRCLEEEYGTASYFYHNVPSFRRAVLEKLRDKKEVKFSQNDFIDVKTLKGDIKFF